MRTSLQVFLIATVMVSNTVTAQTAGRQDAVGSTTGALIAHLPLDGSIVDKVSGVTPTVLVGTGPTEGKIDGAVQFDGSSFVQLPIDISPQALPELTITMWVKPDRLPDDPELRKAFYPNAYLLSDGNGLLTIGNQQKDIPYYSAYSLGASISNSNHPGMRGGWQLLAITRRTEDRTTDEGDVWPHTVLTLYSNGRVTEKAGIRKEKAITPYLSLGASSKGSSGKFRGAIDDVRVYSKAMSNEEIRASASQQNPTRAEGIRTASSGQSGENDSSGRVAGTPTYDQVGREQTFPGDMFDGDEEQFPGDMFDGEETAESTAGAPESAEDPLLGGSATGVDPRAGVGSIGASGPASSMPVSTVDEGEAAPYSPFDGPDIDAPDLTDDLDPNFEFTGDWAIRSVKRQGSEDLYPGSKLVVAVDIEKNDPDGRFPSVRLRVGSGVPTPVSSTKRILISLEVPEIFSVPIPTASGSFQVSADLSLPNGGNLDDYHPSNNSMQISVPVTRYVEEADPVGADDTDDVEDNEESTPFSYPDISLNSEISGSEGSLVWTVYDHAKQDVVTHISIIEKRPSNNPCWISVGGSEVGIESAGCVLSSPPTPTLGVANNPITALQVCHSNFNNRVKGLRVWRQTLKADGSYDGFRLNEVNSAEKLFDRANCSSRWQEIVSCARDAVATGIRAHATDDKEIVGLQLMCTEVRPN